MYHGSFFIFGGIMANVTYQAHCSNLGWLSEVKNGSIAGTVGQNRALEAFRVNDIDVPGLGIQAFGHVQNLGWSAGNILREDVGSTGLGLHLEAIKIGLIGEEAPNYDIWYRCHLQNYGWLNWSCNGAENGSVGGNVQIEAIQIEVHAKSENWTPRVDYDAQFMDLTPQPPQVDRREIVLNAARSWLGYLAEEDNAFGVDNYCIAFVCDCMRSAGIEFINTAWCDDAKYWAIERGMWVGSPEPGFPVAFDWDNNGVTNHFGLVESVNADGSINTIEANTSGPNGIGIYRKTRYPSEGIEGYINPY